MIIGSYATTLTLSQLIARISLLLAVIYGMYRLLTF